MSAVWIVWEYDGECPTIESIYATEAGARVAAQRLAFDAYAADEAAHDAREQRRIADAGQWRYSPPDHELAPEWVPAKPQPVAFAVPREHYELRVESYELRAE